MEELDTLGARATLNAWPPAFCEHPPLRPRNQAPSHSSPHLPASSRDQRVEVALLVFCFIHCCALGHVCGKTPVPRFPAQLPLPLLSYCGKCCYGTPSNSVAPSLKCAVTTYFLLPFPNEERDAPSYPGWIPVRSALTVVLTLSFWTGPITLTDATLPLFPDRRESTQLLWYLPTRA